MPKNTSITLGDHFTDFVAHEVKTGRFGTASEVVRAGLRLLEHEEKKQDREQHSSLIYRLPGRRQA